MFYAANRDSIPAICSTNVSYFVDWEKAHVNIYLKFRFIKKIYCDRHRDGPLEDDILLHNRKSGFLPGCHPSFQDSHLGVAIMYAFFRLTGGTGLGGSGTVKNDLLILGK